MSEREQLEAAIVTLEAQRAILGDAVVDASIVGLRAQLAALDAAAAPEQQRKQVTVLFADVVGFTAMSETMDAELVTGIMNQAWQALDAAILEHGGRIDKHIGDAVMALWGVDAAREDDPEQAIRAALAMQEALQAFCLATGGDEPLLLNMRIGLHTGPVLLGQVGSTQEFTAMGDAVNLASRLEHAAAVGAILVSHATYAQVRGVFDVQPLEPLAIKGKAEPVQAYEVQRAKPRAFRLNTRGVEGVETRMIGRDHELGMLQEAYYDAAEESETRLIIVVGDAGVGKSRLLYEFDNWLELLPDWVTYFKGRSTAALESVPYSLFRDLFAFRFDIRDSDSKAVALEKFRRGFLRRGAEGDALDNGSELPVTDLTADQADLVGHWLGFDFSQSTAVSRLLGSPEFASVAQSHLVRYVRHTATDGPVVVLLEDIHWADDQSLDLISHLVKALPESRLLMICVTRPSLYERRALWNAGETAASRIDLRPLSKRASRALVDEILQQVDDIPDVLRELIVDAAEGNPFFTEELVKMFIEQGVIVRGVGASFTPAPTSGVAERWRVQTDRLNDVRIPPTLTGLLQARLDGLPQLERELLQRAAVVGRLFWDGVVADLAQTEQEAIQPVLQTIRSRELIFQREHSAFAGSDEYVFKHNLLRDVAYERVLLKWRQEFHTRVAHWLEANAGERLNEYLGLIAEHYQQAGEERQAAAYLLRVGKEALNASAYPAARRAFERVLELTGADAETDAAAAIEALVFLGEIAQIQGDLDLAAQLAAQGLAGARRINDAHLEVTALITQSRVFGDRGEYRQGRAIMNDEALPLARTVGGSVLARALVELSGENWMLGDLDAAEVCVDEALALAREIGDTANEARAMNMRGNIAGSQGDMKLALERHLELLDFSRSTGNTEREAITLLNLGSGSYELGDYEAARSYGRAALSKIREVGYSRGESMTLCNLAQADLKLGDWEGARSEVRQALQLARQLDIVPDMLFAVQVMAEIRAAEGDHAGALVLLWLVHDHPAADFQGRQEIRGIFEQWAVDETALAAARTAARELDLDTVVADILESGS